MSSPRPVAARFLTEAAAGSDADLTKVRVSWGWKGRTSCGTDSSKTVRVERLSLLIPFYQSEAANSHRGLDLGSDGLARDDSNERSGELDDVRLDRRFRCPLN